MIIEAVIKKIKCLYLYYQYSYWFWAYMYMYSDSRQHMLVCFICVHIKAAPDPKNWIRDPAGSDPDPDPLTLRTFFHQ